MTNHSACGAIVLAGGRSSRLGQDKALVQVDGQPLVQWLPARLSEWLSPVLVVTDRVDRYSITSPQVADAFPETGPLGGLATGLQALRAPAAFACACDMPLIRAEMISLLCAALPGYDMVIPERGGRLEPLCAVYSTTCLPAIHRLLVDRKLRLAGVAAEVRTRVVPEATWRTIDPDGDSFLSINTPADLAHMQARAGRYGLAIAVRS